MTNLRKLNASGFCGINQEGIKGLNLIELNAEYNPKITDVSFMKKLRKLDAGFNCGITPEGIRGLNLIKLHTTYNPNFKTNEIN